MGLFRRRKYNPVAFEARVKAEEKKADELRKREQLEKRLAKARAYQFEKSGLGRAIIGIGRVSENVTRNIEADMKPKKKRKKRGRAVNPFTASIFR